MKRILIFVASATALCAQTSKEYDFHLDNGAEVIYQTFAQGGEKGPAPNLGTARAMSNTIERNVMDEVDQRQLGFILNIEKLPGDPVQFRVSMGQQAMWGFFGRSAPPRIIQNGDRVLLNVMQNAAGGREIFDTFQVGLGVGMHAMPMAKTVPRAVIMGAPLHLQNPELVAGNSVLGKRDAAVSGATVSIAADPALFRFSAQQQPGYRMEGIAEGNTLMFVAGSERFDIRCSAPVVDGDGAWYVWVRREPLRFDLPKDTLVLAPSR